MVPRALDAFVTLCKKQHQKTTSTTTTTTTTTTTLSATTDADSRHHLGYLGRNGVPELAQLAYLPQQDHQALGVVHHQDTPLIDVHELPK